MTFQAYLDIFRNRRIGAMLTLGFASGLPLALTSGTLQAWMTVEGLDIKTIGFFSLVGQAYIFKFLWAPLMDRYTPPLLGRRRGWLLVTQIGLVLGIAGMAFCPPHEALWTLAALATLVAFLSASQDIVFDAYSTDVLRAPERGVGAAVKVLGYRLAMLVSGGLALWLADRVLGWQQMYLLMAGLMGIGIVSLLWAPEAESPARTPRSMEEAILGPLRDFFSRPGAWWLLLLIVLYKLGDAFAGSLSTTFLIRGVGFSAGEVGLVNKTLGLAATIVGALFGGTLMVRLGLYRSLMLFGILQGVSNLGYWILAVTPPHLWTMGATIAVENLCGGMGTAAFVALLMTLCNRSFSATQYALLSALASVGRVYVGPSSGYLVEAFGWSAFYLSTVVVAVPGVVLLWAMRNTVHRYEARARAAA
ncbi:MULTISPECIES: muropeptide transporter [Cupriavidus]|uniref:Anhydromuropeptide permease n=1 Tax=Cupriavidus basilensis TaxID=68895 RepID=A0A0C4Y4D3_9BURK|nr:MULTISPECIES: muropeptide transporter [Cupriavidus]AJG17653.1 AmpG permease [Cupriavidus basilensis]MBB1630853.1 muropeptide transporter AmpG [Cupriavidus sp. UME77]MCP3021384.1 muropeptide transporter [Cupriavidus basilensis]MDR3381007.1 muropeptide transporter [Cupriavidus basilensis]QOT76784.1 muropeptide transporter [Cupriavidus basilensis]